MLTTISRLFVARANANIAVARGAAPEDMPAPQPAVPVFLTAQSLVSFPGAAMAINILWNLVSVLNESVAKSRVVPLVMAFFIGLVIYLISISAEMSRRNKLIGLVVAVINSAWLGLNALGIDIVKPPSPFSGKAAAGMVVFFHTICAL